MLVFPCRWRRGLAYSASSTNLTLFRSQFRVRKFIGSRDDLAVTLQTSPDLPSQSSQEGNSLQVSGHISETGAVQARANSLKQSLAPTWLHLKEENPLALAI
jgi:hypothetical protein